MADDRTALIRMLTRLEDSPRPGSWRGRFRRVLAIRHARQMLEWDDARQEGPACLIPLRNSLVSGLMLLWCGSALSGLFFGDHALTLARALRVLGVSLVPLAFIIGYARLATTVMWKKNERDYARFLEQAKALPAPAGNEVAGLPPDQGGR
jgi:hypothetical protein